MPTNPKERNIEIKSYEPGVLGRTLELRKVHEDGDKIRVVIDGEDVPRTSFVGLAGDLKAAVLTLFPPS